MVDCGLWGILFVADGRSTELDLPKIAASLHVSEYMLRDMLREMPFMRRVLGKQEECLVARLETYYGDCTVRLRYDRKDGRIIWHPPATDYGRTEGRFASLLPPKAEPAKGQG